MSKGRRVPPPAELPPHFEQLGDVGASADDVLPGIQQPGLYMVYYEHDSWCRTLRTQRAEDCNCTPYVRLLRFKEPKR